MIRLTTRLILAAILVAGIATIALGADTDLRDFAPVQEGYKYDAETVLPYHPTRLVVKFTEEAYAKSDLQYTRDKATTYTTGLATVDALGRDFAVLNVKRGRAYQPQNRLQADLIGVERVFHLETDGTVDIPTMAAAFAKDPNVESATPDWRAFPAAVPNDPMYASHWGHNNTAQMVSYDWSTHTHTGPTVGTVGFDANAPGAWDVTYGSSSVVIAIIDSGVDVGHPDLNQVAGYDYGDNDSNPDDDSASPGHGTACAGVAAAISNNNLGAVGIAGGCQIMPLKIANSAGSMYFSAIIDGIYHAADNGADIISMSLGAAISSDASTDAAIQYAYNAGLTIFAATGNENYSTISYPAINGNVIAVGAASPCGERKRSSSSSTETNPGVYTDPNGYTCDGERWWGSNYGVTTQDASGAVDIIAPTILPTTDIQGSGGYDSSDYSSTFNGTSCSTPYAAGVAALVKSQNPTWTPAQIRNQIVTTATDVTGVESGSGWDRYSGYGMVDAEAALGGGGPVTDPPVANFTGSPTSGFMPLEVNFTDTTTDNPTGWSWTFGDGGTSSAQNPSHTYTSAGTYTVTLTATNTYGSDGETKTGYITVSDPGDLYASLPFTDGFEAGSFGPNWTSASTNTGRIQVTTSNTPHSGSYHLTMDCSSNGTYSTNNADLHLNLAGEGQVDMTFWWKDFSDETHSQDGVFFSDDGGSSFTKVLDLNGASYTNNSWTEWNLDVDDLASSNGLSLSSTFVVRFQQYDNYMATTDGMAWDDITITAGAAGSAPVAAFSGTPTTGTAPLAVTFTDASTDGPTAWSWTFGDGGTSNAQNPSHSYTSAGTYTVTLTVSNAYGSDGETKTNYITVNDPVGGGDWVEITYDDFESGVGNYTDGGGDCVLYTGGTYSYQGSNSMQIRDNSGTASSFYHTSSYNVSTYVELEVDFYFIAISMDNTSEDFWLQYYDGSAWQTVGSWARTTDFDNGVFYHVTVTIPSSYNYPANAKLRFMCDASGNRDYVYIDQVTWSGLTAGGSNADLAAKAELPSVFSVDQNYPNPFNPMTTIKFSLPKAERVDINVYNIRGQKVATLVSREYGAGRHEVVWNAQGVASGQYFYRVQTPSQDVVKRMMLIK